MEVRRLLWLSWGLLLVVALNEQPGCPEGVIPELQFPALGGYSVVQAQVSSPGLYDEDSERAGVLFWMVVDLPNGLVRIDFPNPAWLEESVYEDSPLVIASLFLRLKEVSDPPKEL